MKHSFSRRKKIFLSVTAGVVLVVFLAGAAGAAYISGKMDLLSRPSAGQGGSSQSGTDPGDAVLSFDGMDLSGIDVMENGGSIAPPEGGCCFSERMRKLFRKNEKNVLRFCNKKAKEKRRLQRVKKPM